jgi:hypothetical protein
MLGAYFVLFGGRTSSNSLNTLGHWLSTPQTKEIQLCFGMTIGGMHPWKAFPQL